MKDLLTDSYWKIRIRGFDVEKWFHKGEIKPWGGYAIVIRIVLRIEPHQVRPRNGAGNSSEGNLTGIPQCSADYPC
jgi:hypothetical protein